MHALAARHLGQPELVRSERLRQRRVRARCLTNAGVVRLMHTGVGASLIRVFDRHLELPIGPLAGDRGRAPTCAPSSAGSLPARVFRAASIRTSCNTTMPSSCARRRAAQHHPAPARPRHDGCAWAPWRRQDPLVDRPSKCGTGTRIPRTNRSAPSPRGSSGTCCRRPHVRRSSSAGDLPRPRVDAPPAQRTALEHCGDRRAGLAPRGARLRHARQVRRRCTQRAAAGGENGSAS